MMRGPGRGWASRKLRGSMPSREAMAQNRYLAPIAHRFLSPELWRFTRRSVPRGVALGLFAGFMVPVGQIFLAAFLALPLRANVPLAAVVTLVTNPFTIAFWAVVANRLGAFLLQTDAAHGGAAPGDLTSDAWATVSQFSELAGVTAFGFVVLAVVSAALGHVVAGAAWRVMVARRRAKRLALMAARLDQSLNPN